MTMQPVHGAAQDGLHVGQRIGLLMHSLNPRGGVVHTLELAEALVQQGHRVTVLAAAQPGQALFRPTSARLSVAPMPPPQSMPSEPHAPSGLVSMVGTRITAMAAHLRTLDLGAFDVLHSQDGITANALADLQDEGRIDRFVRTVHHLDVFDDAQMMAWQARGVRQARTLLCVSGVWQDTLRRDWGRTAHRVTNGVNLQRFHNQPEGQDDATLRQLGVQPDQPFWLAVGGVEGRKNTARLLAAFAEVMHEAPLAQLVIVGGASLLEHAQAQRDFEAVRAAHGLAPGQAHAHRLVLTGPVADAALPALYRRATALAMPSVKEGFGLVAIEAMACGTPAIVSRIAPFTEHLQPHEAFWVDPLDVGSIAQALRDTLIAPMRGAIAAPARSVAARFDWQVSARQHLAIYLGHAATAASPDTTPTITATTATATPPTSPCHA
jgi:glycogen synthase